MDYMNKIKLIVSISIIIFLSGCVNEQSKENVPVSTPSVTTVPSIATVPSVPTTTTKIPVIIYNDNNDLASSLFFVFFGVQTRHRASND